MIRISKMLLLQYLFASNNQTPLVMEKVNDAKEVFKQCGTCSQTFGHLINREFDNAHGPEERSLDPLAGGIYNQGHQCGMLWGASLAAGIEALQRYGPSDKAMAVAMEASRHIVGSFMELNGTVNCREIIGYDLSSAIGMIGFMFKTMSKGMNNSPCFNMAEAWAPRAVDTVSKGTEGSGIDFKAPLKNCASEVVKSMGASPEEAIMVAGFAGGLGLSGHGCGALSAAIWMKSLAFCREQPDKNPPIFRNKEVKQLIKAFQKTTGSEMKCSAICGKKFNNADEHSQYIQSGGCREILELLGKSNT